MNLLGMTLADSPFPSLILVLSTVLLCFWLRSRQGEFDNQDGHAAFQELNLALIIFFSSCAATLCLIQALRTDNVMYALLVVAMGLLLIVGGRPAGTEWIQEFHAKPQGRKERKVKKGKGFSATN